MKKLLSFAALLTLVAGTAHAQFFGQMSPLGPTQSSGLEMVGAYVGIASHVIGATGQLRFGMGNETTDFGIQGGLSKVSDGGPTSFGAQGDLKYGKQAGSNAALKIGGQGAVFFSHSGGTYSGNTFGVKAVPGVSYSAKAGDDMRWNGWAGFGFEWSHTSFNGVSGSGTSGVLVLGSEILFTGNMGITAEFNHSFATGGGDGFMAGVNFGMGPKSRSSLNK